MNKKNFLLLAAAAALLLCSCGKSGDSRSERIYQSSGKDSSSQEAVEETAEDKEFLNNAKDTITEFYDHAQKGEYSSMSMLCTMDLADYYGFDEMTDGEDIEIKGMTFDEENRAVVTDDDGKKLAVWGVTVERQDIAAPDPDAEEEAVPQEETETLPLYIAVEEIKGRYYIGDICDRPEDCAAADYLKLKFEQYTDNHTRNLEIAVQTLILFYQTPPEDNVNGLTFNDGLTDGDYKSGDGSEFVDNLEKLLADVYSLGYDNLKTDKYIKTLDDCEYTITIKDGALKKAAVGYAKGDMNIVKEFPK